MAEIVLTAHLEREGLGTAVVVDSTGVSAEEHGNPIDRRARASLLARGYEVPNHRARQARPVDLAERDLVLAMTARHARELERLAAMQPRMQGKVPTDGAFSRDLGRDGERDGEPGPGEDGERGRAQEPGSIRMFRSFDPAVHPSSAGDGDAVRIAPAGAVPVPEHREDLDVADPWYGGPQDFEDCLDEIEQTIPGIIAHVRDALTRAGTLDA